ncbi:MAG: pilus assembly protein PilX [Ruminiclostridium sp.]|nr:pilus assembly protein PilX [Ruminiclostridium sp.]
MRKINAVLSIVMLALFLLHIIVGSLQLFGLMPGGNAVMQVLAWVLVSTVAAHIVIGIKLTFDTLIALKRSGAGYFSENKLFWTRRMSGFAVMLFMVSHIFKFMGSSTGGAFRLDLFDVPQLVCSVLLVLSLLVHIVSNIRPLLLGFGAGKPRELIGDSAFVISILLLISGAGFVVYFVRWLV